MYIVSRKTDDDEVEVASVDNAEAAEKLFRSFKKLWRAEYIIKQAESVDPNPPKGS